MPFFAGLAHSEKLDDPKASAAYKQDLYMFGPYPTNYDSSTYRAAQLEAWRHFANSLYDRKRLTWQFGGNSPTTFGETFRKFTKLGNRINVFSSNILIDTRYLDALKGNDH